ncbi:MAG: ABC transporter ATP-binding protein [Deltaproteobacteria bacterium]|nr:ABC transporter ATP-binding protein [Deltaproteobacteria bacterium]
MLPLLEIRNLTTRIVRGHGETLVVDGVSLALQRGAALGVVGESGCGKTLLALSVMRLLPPAGAITGGQILLEGRDLVGLPEREMRAVRGRRLAMVFQAPQGALNPVLSLGVQLAEAIRLHRGGSWRQAHEAAVEALRAVGLADAGRLAENHSHQLSGGMRQRAMIAMALSCNPDLLLADEPTTALDATVQAQILALLRALRAERRLTLFLISHDLTVVSTVCDEVAVLYAGQIVERGPAKELLERPVHPYTAALRRASLADKPRPAGASRPRLDAIPGHVPEERLAGCSFAPRCPRAAPECWAARPPLAPVGPHRAAACLYPLSDGLHETAS